MTVSGCITVQHDVRLMSESQGSFDSLILLRMLLFFPSKKVVFLSAGYPSYQYECHGNAIVCLLPMQNYRYYCFKLRHVQYLICFLDLLFLNAGSQQSLAII